MLVIWLKSGICCNSGIFMFNRWLSSSELVKPRFLLYMKERDIDKKKTGCNNFNHLPEREAIIQRQLILEELFPKNDSEEWKALPEHPLYLISNWGRILHLSSYCGKPKLIIPTIRFNKYPSFTVSTGCGKRKGITLTKYVKLLFKDIIYV